MQVLCAVNWSLRRSNREEKRCSISVVSFARQIKHVAWDGITESISMNNQHQHNMDTCFQLPPWISVLLFRHFLVVFTPQFQQLRSGRVQCCETEKRVQLLTSDLISSLRWPQCLIWILHDWSALIRSSAWPSLTGSEMSDSCSSLWKRWDSAEIRTGSDWNPCWEIMKPLNGSLETHSWFHVNILFGDRIR